MMLSEVAGRIGGLFLVCMVQSIFAIQSLQLDVTNCGTVTFPGQELRFEFTGTQGQQVYFDSLQVNAAEIRGSLVSPSGEVLFDVPLNLERPPVYLPQNGSYTVKIRGQGDATGGFAFRLIDVGAQPAIGINATNSVTLSPSSLTVIRRFSGTAGQLIALDAVSWSGTDAEWLLIDPANQIVVEQSVNSNLGTNLLRVTGTYLIVVRGTVQDGAPVTFQFRVRDVSDAPVTASGFNIVRSGNIDPGQTNTFAITGSAGTPIYYDALVQEGSSDIGMQIVAPSGEIVVDRNSGYSWGNATYDYGPVVLPRSGTYTLRIIGNSGGYYRFRVLNLWSNSTPIVFGATNASTFTETNSTVVYRLEVQPGQRLYYDALVPWRDIRALVWRATASDASFVYSAGDCGDFWYRADAPETLYYMFSCNTMDPTTSYRFRILRLDQLPVEQVNPNVAVSNFLADPYAVQIYRFEASTGQRIFFDFTSSLSGRGNWELYNPRSERVSTMYSFDSDYLLPETVAGTYAIVVSPWNSEEPPNADFSFRFVRISCTITNAVVFGQAYSNSVTAVGQEHWYSFTGSIGMRLYYDALLNTTSQIPVRLIAPDGTAVWGLPDADNEYNPITLNQNGTYTLVFGGETDATGPYSFRLINIDQPPASGLTFGAVIRGTNNPYYASVFRVSVRAGSQLFCDSRLESYSGSWAVYDTDDTQITANNLASDMEPIPGHSGIGLLVISASGESCPYEFRVLDPTRITNTVSIGTVVSNQLADAGDEHYLTFNAVAGQRLYFDALDSQANNVLYALISPDGRYWIWNAWNNWDSGISTIPVSGTYTLRFHNSSSGSASYRFRILNLATQPVLPLGTTQSGQLNPVTQTHIYRLQAVAGQKIHFSSLYASSGDATWSVQDPYNNQLVSGSIQNDLGTVFFPADGTYALIISGWGPGSGTLDYQILATDVTDAPMTPAGFGTYSGFVNAGETNYVYFNAAAGTPIYIDSLTNNRSVTLRVRDTNGVVVLETAPGYGSAGGPDPGFCILPSSGTYTVEIEGYYGGDYAFRILNLLTDAPVLTTGVEYDVSFTLGFQTDVYRVSGTNAQILVYDALMNGSSVYLCMLKPNGAALFGGFNWWNYYSASAYSDNGPVRLPSTGTYYLIVLNDTDQTPNYKFRLLDLASASRIVLGLNYTNSIPPFCVSVLCFTNPAASYFFDALDLSNLRWEHIPPGSERATAGGGDWDFESSSPVAGTNFVLIKNDTDSTRTYAFRVLAPISITNSLSFGSTYSNIISPGQEHWYTFTGVAGQWIYFDSLPKYDGWMPSFNVTIFDPTGYQIWTGAYFDDTIPPLRLVKSGLYMVRLHNYADYDWSYAFRILDVADQPVISMDAFYSDTVTPGTKAQLFRFTPGPSMKVFFDNMNNFSSYCYIYDPANRQLGGSWVYDFQVSTTLEGEHLLILNRSDANDYTYAFRLVPGNHAPSFTSPTSATVAEQTTLSFTNVVSDPEIPNDQVTFSLAGDVPSGLTINPSTGVITWIPGENQGPSTNTFTIVAIDDGIPPLSGGALFTIVVQEVNRAPTLTMPTNQTINELTTMSVYASASDPDIPSNTIVFALVSAPSGVNINPNTGLITWTPSEAQGPSTNTITVKVTDSNPWAINENQLSTTNSFVVVVKEVNSAPVLPAQTNRTINELTLLVVTNTATDSDIPVNTLTYQLVNPPAGATISTNGIITWTPTEAQGPGTYTITTVVTDNGTPQLSATNEFTVTVNEVNSAPVLPVQTNRTINELTLLVVTNTATDSDIPVNTLTYQLVNPPAGATISTNGIITWTPSESQGPGTYTITTVVTDNGTPQLSATNEFTVTVNEINLPPVLNMPPNTNINELATLTVTVSATDTDVPTNTLCFSLISPPTGMVINTNSGLITWTPTEAQGPSTNIITVVVTDRNTNAVNAQQLSATNSFTVIVNEVNSPPVLTLPANQIVHAGTYISLNATASDPDIPPNACSFALLSGPTGLTVGTEGLITWQTTDAHAGTTNTVTVRVTDNGAPPLSSTNSFVITVLGRPVISSVVCSGDLIVITWSAIPGTVYRLQYKTNLTEVGWQTVGDVIASGDTAFKVDTLDRGTTKFYRVCVPQEH